MLQALSSKQKTMETISGFQQFFMFMGPWKWPLILIALIVLILIGIKIYDLLIKKNASKQYLNAILFWGFIAALLGIVGQLSATWAILVELMDAADISAPMVWTGYLSTYTPVLFGFIILLAAAICWWGLRNVYYSLIDKTSS